MSYFSKKSEWKSEMQRIALAVALSGTIVCAESHASHAQIAIYPEEVAVCRLFPPWYPRSWELMVRPPCLIYYEEHLPFYEVPSYRLPAGHPARHAHYRPSRRPYLRPGWWW